mmetsp:Transcript_131469/g.195855  ORF Transcript_131469/g.195855 Transcript_131469/m.195855 type:complete len:288 (+) Transcript_131469:495-1358(+)
MTDTFDGLGVGFGPLQETAVTSQNLVQRISGKVEESLGRVDDGIVGKRRIGDDKVLLRSLQSLDETEIGIVEHLVGGTLRVGNQGGIRCVVSGILGEKPLGLVVTQVLPDGAAEFLVLLLQKGNRLLERLEQELFADSASLGVFAIAFTTFVLLLLTHLTISGARRLFLGHGVLKMVTLLWGLLVGNALGLGNPRGRGTHNEGGFFPFGKLCGVKTSSLIDRDEPSVSGRLGGHGGDLGLTGIQDILLLAEEDCVSVGGEHDIPKDVIKIQGGRGASLGYRLLGSGR